MRASGAHSNSANLQQTHAYYAASCPRKSAYQQAGATSVAPAKIGGRVRPAQFRIESSHSGARAITGEIFPRIRRIASAQELSLAAPVALPYGGTFVPPASAPGQGYCPQAPDGSVILPLGGTGDLFTITLMQYWCVPALARTVLVTRLLAWKMSPGSSAQ